MHTSRKMGNWFGRDRINYFSGLIGSLIPLLLATNYHLVTRAGVKEGDVAGMCRNLDAAREQGIPLWSLGPYRGEIEAGFYLGGRAHYLFVGRDEDSPLGVKVTTEPLWSRNREQGVSVRVPFGNFPRRAE